MTTKKTATRQVAMNRCSSCGISMIRNSKEYYCPKCGLIEEIAFDGI